MGTGNGSFLFSARKSSSLFRLGEQLASSSFEVVLLLMSIDAVRLIGIVVDLGFEVVVVVVVG